MLQIANSKFYMGLTASTSTYTQDIQLSNWNIQLVIPSPSSSYARLSPSNPSAIRTNVDFSLDLYVNDACNNRYVPTDSDSITDVNWIVDTSSNCKLMSVSQGSQSGFTQSGPTYQVYFSCSQVGNKTILLTYKSKAIPNAVIVTISANVMTIATTNIQDLLNNNQLPTIDTGFTFNLIPEDSGGNLAQTTPTEILNKISVVWQNPADSRTDFVVTANPDGSYNFHINTDIAGTYNISSVLFLTQIQGGYYIVTALAGAANGTTSYIVVQDSTDPNNPIPFTTLNISAGQNATATVYLRDSQNNSVASLNYQTKLIFQLWVNGNVTLLDTSKLNVAMYDMNLRFQMTLKGVNMFQIMLGTSPITCLNCIFTINPTGSVFANANLFIWSNISNTYVQNTVPPFSLQKGSKFNFLLVLEDKYYNVLNSINSTNYLGNLSGNYMNVLNLVMSRYTSNGVQVQTQDSDATYYNNLVGMTNYQIGITEISSGTLRNFPLTIVSDGSDSDAGNGNYFALGTKLVWSVGPLNNYCLVGSVYTVSIELLTSQGLRYNNWINASLIVPALDIFYPGANETLYPVRQDTKPGMYLMNLVVTQVTGKLRTLSFKINGSSVSAKLRFYEQAGVPYQAFVNNLQDPINRIMNPVTVLNTYTFTYTMFDQFLNPVNPTSGTVDLVLRSVTQPTLVNFKPICTKNGIGFYPCSITPNLAGNYTLNSGLFVNGSYLLTVNVGSPDATFTQAGILNDVTQEILAGAQITFYLSVKDSQGSQLTKSEVSTYIANFSLILMFIDQNQMTQMPLTLSNIQASGEIQTNITITTSGHYKFLPTYNSIGVTCQICAVTIDPNIIDVNKVVIRMIQSDSTSLLVQNSTILLDNDEVVPSFIMQFYDTYNNPRPVETNFSNFTANLNVYESVHTYTFAGSPYMGNILFQMNPTGLTVYYQEELANNNCNLSFTGVSLVDQRRISKNFAANLKGSDFDNQFTYDSPDPNNVLIIPNTVSSVAGQFISVSVELRAKNGQLFFDQTNDGFYPNSLSPFKLISASDNNSFSGIQVSRGKLNGTYVLTFNVTKTYTADNVYLYYAQPNNTSNFIQATNPLVLTVLPAAANYVVVVDPVSLGQNCKANTLKQVNLQVFDCFANQIFNSDIASLALSFLQNGNTIVPTSALNSNGVQCSILCKNAGLVTFLSLGFRNNISALVSNYTFTIIPGDSDPLQSQATLSASLVNASDPVQWRLYLVDTFGNKIQANSVDLTQFSSSVLQPGSLSTVNLTSLTISNDNTYLYYAEQYDVAGNYKFSAYLNGLPIFSSNFLLTVLALEADWDNAKLALLDVSSGNFIEYENISEAITQSIFQYPEFQINLYDSKGNVASSVPSGWNLGLNLSQSDLQDGPIVFCKKNGTINGFIMCDDNTLQPPSINLLPKERWDELVQNETYSMGIGNEGNFKLGGYLNVTGNESDSGTSNLDVDILNTVILPFGTLVTQAGVSVSFSIELRTTNANLRPNWFYSNPMANLSLGFKYDNNKQGSILNYTIVDGDVHGRYFVNLTSYKTYSLSDPNIITVSIDNVPFTIYTPNLVVTPGNIANLQPINPNTSTLLTKIPDSTTDSLYSVTFKAFDAWGNTRPISPSDIINIMLFNSQSTSISFLTQVTVNALITVSFQPQIVDIYTFVLALGGNFSFTINEGQPFFSNCLGSVNVSANQSVAAGSTVQVSVSFFDKYNNIVNLNTTFLNTFYVNYFYKRPDVTEGFIVGNFTPVLQSNNSIIFQEIVTVKGIYTFKVQMKSNDIPMKQSTVNVIPAAVNLTMSNLRYFDTSSSKYLLMYVYNSIQEDNLNTYPLYLLELTDSYSNTYDIFPPELINNVNVTLFGNSIDPSSPVTFTANSLIGNSLFINITDPNSMIIFREAVYRPNPYSLKLTLLTTLENVTYPVILLGEGSNDTNADTGKPLNLSLTVLSKSALSFKAGLYDTFVVELHDINNNRKVDVIPIFGYSFQQADRLSDGNFNAFSIPGDLLGRFLITVNGTKANLKVGPTILTITVNGSQIPQTVAVNVSPNVLTQIQIPTNLSITGTTDTNYLFDVFPYDMYMNVVDVQESDVNLQIKYPGNRSTYQTTKDLSTGKLSYSVACKDAGVYIIQSPLLNSPENFTILPGQPSSDTSSVYISPTNLTVGQIVTVSIIVSDANNNKVSPSKNPGLVSQFTVQVQSATNTSNYNVTVNTVQDSLITTFTSTQSGVVSVTTLVNNKAIVCESCSVTFNPGSLDLSKTQYFTQTGSSFVQTTLLQIAYGATHLNFIGYLFDTYGNAISGTNSSETFTMTLSGNYISPIFSLTVATQSSNMLLFDLNTANSDALSRVVPANNYTLSLTYFVNTLQKSVNSLGLQITGQNNGAGNGPWSFVRINPVPTLTLTAGVEGFFDVVFYTAQYQIFNGILDVTQVNIYDNSDKALTSSENLTMTVYPGDANGKIRLGFLGKVAISRTQQRNITFAYLGTTIPQDLFVFIVPNIPDLSQTQLTEGLPASCITGVVQTVILQFFDTYSNAYPTASLTTSLVTTVLTGQANFGTPISRNVYSLVLPITPIYPPSTLQIMLYYQESVNISYPILSFPLATTVQTYLDPNNTQIIGTSLPGISTDLAFIYYVLLKDKSGYCFEASEQVVVNFTGPLNLSTVATFTDIPSYVDANATGLNLSSNTTFTCQKLYYGYLQPQSFQKVGYYQIDVYILGENNNNSVKTINYTYISPGPTVPSRSILSIPALLSRGRIPLALEVNTPLIFNLVLVDQFDNPITQYRNTTTLSVTLPDYPVNVNGSTYNISLVNNSDGSYSLNLTVDIIGTINSLNITLNGIVLSYPNLKKFDVPDTISITAGPCSPNQVTIENGVYNSTNATVGELNSFFLTCRDDFGNVITTGGEANNFQTLMSGTNLDVVGVDYASTSITDNNNGQYTYSFTASWAGNYSITIQLSGDPVGTPFNVGVSRTRCPDPSLPMYCDNSNTCASGYLACGFVIFQNCTDPTKPFHCLVNSQYACVAGQYECDCPDGYSKCSADLKCVPDVNASILCSNVVPMNCPTEYPYYCAQSGTCRLDAQYCPSQPGCPPEYSLCADQTCSKNCSNFTDNSYNCPLTQPWKCEDQSCVFDPTQCPTRMTCNNPGYIICPDKTCATSELICRAPETCTGMYLCPDQSCRPSQNDCPKAITCSEGYALCEDQTCRASCNVVTSRILAKIGKWRRVLQSTASNNSNSNCQANYFVCPGGECVTNSFLCPTVQSCGPNKRVCPDYSCAGLNEKCIVKSCTNGQTLCWDGKCVDNSTQCSTRTSCPQEIPIKCSDGSCVNSTSACPTDIQCPPYYPYRCATGECRANDQECPTLITCPSNKPIQCTDGSCVVSPFKCKAKAELIVCGSGFILCPDGSCALSKLLCPPIASCNPSQIRCWDNTCVDNITECNTLEATTDICPVDRNLRCPDGSCRAALQDCPTQIICPITTPVKCDDGTCKQSVSQCAVGTDCGYGLLRCPDGSCTSNANLCGTSVTCSSQAPYICFDSTCKIDPRDCPTPPACSQESPILCPDGTCTSQRVNCQLMEVCDPKIPVRCPNMNCYASVNDCKPITGCPAGKIMCQDGSCATYISYCPTTACPQFLNIQCPDGTCVSNISLCDNPNTGCPYSKPFKCMDGSCTNNASSCDNATAVCPNNLTLCSDGSCASDITNCPNILGCPPETPLLCASGDCIDPQKGNCPVGTCPSATPVKCIDGTCANSITFCPSYFTALDISQCLNDPLGNMIPCADGRCVASADLCKPLFVCANGKVRCGDGSCRVASALCPLNNNTCPPQKPARCSIGACAVSTDTCPNTVTGCPNNYPVKCPLTGSCVMSDNNCTDASNKTILLNNCTMLFPYRCSNGTCVTNSSYCGVTPVCDVNQIQCPNGICVTNKTLCASTCPSPLYTCPDGTCKSDYTQCLTDNGCPIITPFLCADGSCKQAPLAINGEDGCLPHLVCPDYKPYLCSNGECQGSPSQCQIQKPCPVGLNYTCPDYNCVASPDQCSQQTLCPPATPVLCGSGYCEKTAMECLSTNAMYCPDEQPILCASGQCVKYNWNCTDSDTRQGKLSSARRMLQVSNSTANLVVCSDGSFRTNVNSCVIIPSCNPGQYRCNSSACVDTIQDCATSDSLLVDCVNGTSRCLDGICRSECLNYQGCPFDANYHCGNGLCATNEGECAGDSVCETGYFRCIDNSCVNDATLCSIPLRNYIAEQLKITVSPLMTSSLNFIQQGISGIRLATLTLPAGSLLPLALPNITINASINATLPSLGLLINPVAQSQINDLITSIDPTQIDYVENIFPYNSGYLPFHQTVRSPIINLTAINRGSDPYQFQLILEIEADILNSTSKLTDYCLATINQYTNSWDCVNRTLLNPEDTSNTFSYSVPQDGVYTVTFNPAQQSIAAPSEDCEWFCQNKMTILYVFIAIVIAGLIGSYAIWRISRYVNKYKEAKKQMANFREQISEMEKAKTDVVGMTLRDKIEGISFTTNPAFRRESSASKFYIFLKFYNNS